MRSQEGKVFASFGVGASAETATLQGGRYQLFVWSATFGGGSVAVQQLASDGATWITVSALITVAGATVVELPPGMYRLFSITATVVLASLARIPGE